jgi:nuclear pore complex protein Nup85
VVQVLDEMPPDPTSLEDMIHCALFSGQPLEALNHASQLDPWLSAHLADLMVPLSLIEVEIDGEYAFAQSSFFISSLLNSSGISTRDQHILAYAEYLHSDPFIWRITVDYMYSCGEVGKQQADQILLRVPLRLQEHSESNVEGRIKAGDIVGALKDVNQTCFEYQREAVRRTVCRVRVS